MKLLFNYFPNLTPLQITQFEQLEALYSEWNNKINVISRKDIDELYLRHVIHSLGIAKVQNFKKDSLILDVGTGGGFPGIPLAILFPKVQFHLVDSIGKKIKVVDGVVESLALKNIKTTHARAESIDGSFDFIVSRAVTRMENFVPWVRNKISKKQKHERANGILYLKGGNLSQELAPYKRAEYFPLSNYFNEDFFETKGVVYLPIKKK